MDTTKKEKPKNEVPEKPKSFWEKRFRIEPPAEVVQEIRKAAEEDDKNFQPPK